MRLPQVQTDFQRLTSRGLQTDYYKNYIPFYAKKYIGSEINFHQQNLFVKSIVEHLI